LLQAAPLVPVLMFVVPPLINARSTRLNLAGFALVAVVILLLVLNAFHLVRSLRFRHEVKRLIKNHER
jgi:hypothetical protein